MAIDATNIPKEYLICDEWEYLYNFDTMEELLRFLNFGGFSGNYVNEQGKIEVSYGTEDFNLVLNEVTDNWEVEELK